MTIKVIGFYTDEEGRRRPITEGKVGRRSLSNLLSVRREISNSERDRLIKVVLEEEFSDVEVKTESDAPLSPPRIIAYVDRPYPGKEEPNEFTNNLKWKLKRTAEKMLTEAGLNRFVSHHVDPKMREHPAWSIDIRFRPLDIKIGRKTIKKEDARKCEHKNVLYASDGEFGVCLNCGHGIKGSGAAVWHSLKQGMALYYGEGIV